jgi:hypothetical protein
MDTAGTFVGAVFTHIRIPPGWFMWLLSRGGLRKIALAIMVASIAPGLVPGDRLYRLVS